MKSITRFIGAVVLIAVLAGFVLFKLNEKGFLSGNLSEWISTMTEHILGIKNDTEDFLHEEGYLLPTATIDPNQFTGWSKSPVTTGGQPLLGFKRPEVPPTQGKQNGQVISCPFCLVWVRRFELPAS